MTLVEPSYFFLVAGLVIFLGYLGEQVFKRTNVPDIIWLILFGIILGPVLHVVDVSTFSAFAPVFTTFALIFILFEGAINIKLKELFSGMVAGSALAVVNFFSSTIIVTAICIAYGFSFVNSLLLGFILGGTSSAVVIPIVKRLRMGKDVSSALTLESALTDVFAIVATVTLIQIIKIGGASFTGVVFSLLLTLIVPLIIGAIAGYFWMHAARSMGVYSKSYMINIGFLIVLFALLELFGMSGAIACFSFGIILGNSKKILKIMHKEEDKKLMQQAEKFFYSEVSFLLKAFFFVYLGLLVSISTFLIVVLAVLLVIGIYLVRPISVSILFRQMRLTEFESGIMESMFPRGLAAAVLAQLPLLAGIPGAAQFSEIVIGVILASIILTTLAVYFAAGEKFTGLGTLYRSFFRR